MGILKKKLDDSLVATQVQRHNDDRLRILRENVDDHYRRLWELERKFLAVVEKLELEVIKVNEMFEGQFLNPYRAQDKAAKK